MFTPQAWSEKLLFPVVSGDCTDSELVRGQRISDSLDGPSITALQRVGTLWKMKQRRGESVEVGATVWEADSSHSMAGTAGSNSHSCDDCSRVTKLPL